jgi:hypothetical protein
MICGKLALSRQPVNFLIDPRISEFGGAFTFIAEHENADSAFTAMRQTTGDKAIDALNTMHGATLNQLVEGAINL